MEQKCGKPTKRKRRNPNKGKTAVDHTSSTHVDGSKPDHCTTNSTAEIAVAGPYNPKHIAVAPEPTPIVVDSLEDLDLYYELNDGRKRIAVIFNHLNFNKIFNKIPPERTGTEIDGSKMKSCLEKLKFDTSMYFDDPELNTIVETIDKVSAMEATDVCCIVVAVMTHGGEKGVLYAKNTIYPKSMLIDPFENSDTLVGVPKLFFIQACRGEKMDDGKYIQTDGDGSDDDDKESPSSKFPTHADFLVMYSTVNDYVAWRGKSTGSWFIRSLCAELEKAAEPGYKRDLLHMLIFVNRKVAEIESNTYKSGDIRSILSHQKKQIPQIETTMTKLLKFSD